MPSIHCSPIQESPNDGSTFALDNPFSNKVEEFERKLASENTLDQAQLKKERDRLLESDARYMTYEYETRHPSMRTINMVDLLINNPDYISSPFPIFLVAANIVDSGIGEYPPIIGPAVLFEPLVGPNGDYKVHFVLNGNLIVIGGSFNDPGSANMEDLLQVIQESANALIFDGSLTARVLNSRLQNATLSVSLCESEGISSHHGLPLVSSEIAGDTIDKLLEVGREIESFKKPVQF